MLWKIFKIAPTEKWRRKSKRSKTGKLHMIATILKVTLSRLWVSEPNAPIFNHKFLTRLGHTALHSFPPNIHITQLHFSFGNLGFHCFGLFTSSREKFIGFIRYARRRIPEPLSLDIFRKSPYLKCQCATWRLCTTTRH